MFFLIRWLLFPVAVAPHFVRKLLGTFLGVLWFDILRIRRSVALDNVQSCFPEKSKREVCAIARGGFINICLSLVEYSVILNFKPQWKDKFMVVETPERLQNLVDSHEGAFLFSLHTGNGDLALACLCAMGLKVHLISKRFKNKWLDNFWFQARESVGIKFISHTKSSFDILRAIKNNETVAFVIDQFMGPPVGIRTQFFGKTTGTAFGLALFALKTEKKVYPLYNYRRNDGKLGLVLEQPIPLVSTGSREQKIQVLTQQYTDKIEEIVRKHPHEWLWMHKRWKEFKD